MEKGAVRVNVGGKKDDVSCPKCQNPMQKSFATISGNSKYLTFECEVCNHKEMKCTGVLP